MSTEAAIRRMESRLPDDPTGTPAERLVEACRQVWQRESQIVGVFDLDTAHEWWRRASAIEKYLASKKHKQEAQRAARVLEAAIGEALGEAPDPADSERTDLDPSLASNGSEIPKQDRHRFRQLAEHKDKWLPRLSELSPSRSQILKCIREPEQSEAVANPGHWKVRQCRCEVQENHKIPSGSIDWIITDPPYPSEYLDVYDDLSAFAADVLKPGGSLIAMVGQSYLPDIIDRLSVWLRYHWTLAYMTPGGQSAQLWDRKINTFWKPLLWFVNGDYGGHWIGDVCKSKTNDNDKRHHEWGQSESGMADVITRFTYPGEWICDPFCGAGTTGVVAVSEQRNFIGLDSDKHSVANSRQRLRSITSNG